MYQDERKLDFKPLGKAIKKAREAKGWRQGHRFKSCLRNNRMYDKNAQLFLKIKCSTFEWLRISTTPKSPKLRGYGFFFI